MWENRERLIFRKLPVSRTYCARILLWNTERQYPTFPFVVIVCLSFKYLPVKIFEHFATILPVLHEIFLCSSVTKLNFMKQLAKVFERFFYEYIMCVIISFEDVYQNIFILVSYCILKTIRITLYYIASFIESIHILLLCTFSY